MKFDNYKCNLCEQIVSISNDISHTNPLMQIEGHICSKAEEGEHSMWTLISKSDEPLQRAIKIISEEYYNELNEDA